MAMSHALREDADNYREIKERAEYHIQKAFNDGLDVGDRDTFDKNLNKAKAAIDECLKHAEYNSSDWKSDE